MLMLLNFVFVISKHGGGLCSESRGQWSASSSLLEYESTMEAPTSKDDLG